MNKNSFFTSLVIVSLIGFQIINAQPAAQNTALIASIAQIVVELDRLNTNVARALTLNVNTNNNNPELAIVAALAARGRDRGRDRDPTIIKIPTGSSYSTDYGYKRTNIKA
jgi:hypothetical protein